MASKSFKGGEKLQQRLAELAKNIRSGAAVRVGFLEDGKESDGTPSAMVAAIQEFGAPSKGIPPRPFFRTMIKANEDSWGDDLAAILKANDYRARISLDQMGAEMAAQLRQSIIDMNEPALSPVTLLLRERFGNNPGEITFADVMKAREDIAAGVVPQVTGTQSKPLEWTGEMLANVDHEVEDK